MKLCQFCACYTIKISELWCEDSPYVENFNGCNLRTTYKPCSNLALWFKYSYCMVRSGAPKRTTWSECASTVAKLEAETSRPTDWQQEFLTPRRTFFVNNAVISSCGQIMLPRKATGKDSVIAFKRVQKLSYHQSQTHSPFCCDACLWLWSNKRLLWHNQFVYFEHLCSSYFAFH